MPMLFKREEEEGRERGRAFKFPLLDSAKPCPRNGKNSGEKVGSAVSSDGKVPRSVD